jgi:hypothetical protein
MPLFNRTDIGGIAGLATNLIKASGGTNKTNRRIKISRPFQLA